MGSHVRNLFLVIVQSAIDEQKHHVCVVPSCKMYRRCVSGETATTLSEISYQTSSAKGAC